MTQVGVVRRLADFLTVYLPITNTYFTTFLSLEVVLERMSLACKQVDRSIPRLRSHFAQEGALMPKEECGVWVKGKLRDRELNPGLPRDRRRYSPLYYRGDASCRDKLD